MLILHCSLSHGQQVSKGSSEKLQLLHELAYSNLEIPYQHAGTLSNKGSRDLETNHDVRVLDTIAVALTTGNQGDVFAAAFDKRERVQLILAKNGSPTSEDIDAANELISLIGSPDVADAVDIFPFLIRRCGANINKRIQKLHTCIQGVELLDDFRLALQTYIPEADMQAEFPGADTFLGDYRDAVPPFTTVLGELVEMVTDRTTHGLSVKDVSSSKREYAELFFVAEALVRSRFLKKIINDPNLLNRDRKNRVEKLKRRLDKVCQYASGISHLIWRAKRLFPIPHHWVTDTFAGTGEGVFDLCDSAYDAFSRALDQPSLSPVILDKPDTRFASILSNWKRQQTVHASVHAELRIILHLGPPTLQDPSVHPIGVSKRGCLCCVLWITSHNRIFKTNWMTRGSDGKPYATWALPGAACSYAIGVDGRSSVDKAVLKVVSTRLAYALDWLFPGQKRTSDEHVSSGDDSSSGEQGASEWRKKLAAARER